ncbi:hypothetical protein CRM22_005268 [Opisthorchis felineus]|uniref:Uncharacterized protein n=1 Tax=Opisthorchis felineus TaxID=147828 RepID=A0A4V3SEZ6_OPIFE|nr:hypothetical protein CRM22_005268 [Opisthorchis felineus]
MSLLSNKLVTHFTSLPRLLDLVLVYPPLFQLSDDAGLGSDLISAFSQIVDSHGDVHQGVRRSFNVTSKQRLTQSLNQAWRNAQQCGLLNYANKLALSIYAPGRADRSSSASSDSSNRRYLAALLLFEKDADRNFALSVLSLSNRRHREDLGEEMDTAFHDFLIQGEKALATVLAGSNTQLGTRHVTSPFQDHYLNNAINSAFHWLYYWTILKPIASVYSFHIGFSMVLGMLRALGVEPKSALPDAERNLELEAIFIGSPEAFANLCSSILNLSCDQISSLVSMLSSSENPSVPIAGHLRSKLACSSNVSCLWICQGTIVYPIFC